MKISDEILFSFRQPDHELLKDALAVWNYRGDGTQTGDDRIKAAIGAEAFEHYHWDTIVSNGRVTLIVRRHKHPAAAECRGGLNFGPGVWWCISQVAEGEDVEPERASILKRIAPEIHESLKVLPNVEWRRVLRVHYWHHGRGKPKRKSQPPPKGLAFFRFDGGVGIASVTP